MRTTDRSIRTPRARWQRAVALGAVAALALGACGGDDDDDDSGSGSPSAPTDETDAPTDDTGTAEPADFCEAYAGANNATGGGEGDPAAAFEAVQAAAPEEIAADVTTLIEGAPGEQEVPTPEWFAANEAVGTYVEGNCDFEVVEITGLDYEFQMPEQVPTGTVLVKFTNEGAELHEFVAFGIPEDETRTIEELLALPEEEAQTAVTPVTGFAFAVPGGTFYTTYEFTTPGRHAGVCFIPVGFTQEALESGAPPAEDAAPHFTEGMVLEFEVA